MKKTSKIIAGIIAFILIGGLLFFANAFVGNPVSKMLANRNAKQYIETTYPEMDLEVEKSMYDFKDGQYIIEVGSPTSVDIHFPLYISQMGKIKWDNYEDSVLNKRNIFQRINNEYRDLVDTIFESEEFSYESDIDFGEIKVNESEKSRVFGPTYGIEMEDLEFDKIYDIRELAKTNGHLILYIQNEEIEAQRLAEVLLDIKDKFDKKDIPFYAIDLSLEEKKTEEEASGKAEFNMKRFEVNEFLYEDIYEDNLVERVEKAAKELEKYFEQEDLKGEQ